MSVRLIALSTAAATFLMACATSQESPIYQQSTKYKASTPYGTSATTPASTTPVRYVQSGTTTSTASPIIYSGTSSTPYNTIPAGTGYTTIDQQCLNRETNAQLIGSAVGGTIGAVAGKKYIGGTKGTVIGAAVGGTAGYGIGDKAVNCDPVSVPVSHSTSITTTQAPRYVQASQPRTPYVAPTDQAYSGSGAGTPGYDAVMGSLNDNTTYAPTQPQPTYTQPLPQQPVYVNPQPVYVQPPAGYGQQPALTNIASQPLYTAPGYSAHMVTEGDTVYSMARSLCVSVEEIRQINGLGGDYKIRLGEHIQLPHSRC